MLSQGLLPCEVEALPAQHAGRWVGLLGSEAVGPKGRFAILLCVKLQHPLHSPCCWHQGSVPSAAEVIAFPVISLLVDCW